MSEYRIMVGDAIEQLRKLPEESVQCVVTSPPYWGLRDYGTAVWEGGDGECDHKHDTNHQKQGATSQRAGRANVEEQRNENFRDTCKCGARRIDSQIGLEKTPEEYVAKMVEVFSEVRRVLRDDGTCWLNLGDSYASQPAGNKTFNHGAIFDGRDMSGHQTSGKINKVSASGLKPKDLIGIPWRVALALQADGWYLRSDIIWHKPNPMPESVTDRPTKAHEYIFLLTKKPRYYYDAEAIREPQSESTFLRFGDGKAPRKTTTKAVSCNAGEVRANASFKDATPDAILPNGRNKRDVFSANTLLCRMRDDLPIEKKRELVAELLRRGIL